MGTAQRNGATARRKKTQSGQEIFEFALATVLMVPMFLGSFVVGMNLIRSIQANQICRDFDDMYIHGADFSTYPIQQESQRLAQGLNLQISGFIGDQGGTSGHEQANTGASNAGNGLVTATQIMWVGDTGSNNCASVAPQTCTNKNSFVYVQQVQFGNGTLATSSTVTLGQCPAAILNSSGEVLNSVSNGVVDNNIVDARAALPSSAQSAMQSLWQHGPAGTMPLVDQQVVYVVETYFQSPDLSVGGLAGSGVYARYFF